MLKNYLINGKQWQFEEGTQPENAVEVKAVDTPKNKAKKTETKARKTVKKK